MMSYDNIKRIVDISLVTIIVFIVFIPAIIIAVSIKCSSHGPILYWSERVGKDNKLYKMAKFRTMKINAPLQPTHLLTDPDGWITPMGRFLRLFSLDEIPQCWNILKGDMSLVGPRPALLEQFDLIELRNHYGVHRLLPGITGWAQVNGRDELSSNEKAKLDAEYLKRRSLKFDIFIIWRTFFKVLSRENITH